MNAKLNRLFTNTSQFRDATEGSHLGNLVLNNNARELTSEELASVAGGVTKDEENPGHGATVRVPGRLQLDADEQDHIAGAGQ